MEVLYHNRNRCAEEVESELGARYVEREDLFRRAEFLSVHLPLDASTRGSVGHEELAWMPSGSVLVNTARGPVVNEEALMAALRDGHLAAVGLDVFAEEPAFDPRWLEFDNAVLLPHIGSATVATRRRMCVMATANVLAMTRGESLCHVVNPDS